MIEPVELQYFFLSFFAAAMVIVTGALYALLFAFGKQRRSAVLLALAYACYGALAVFVVLLARVLHLDGFWQALTFVMLTGYLLAPHGIWRLCVSTYRGA
jgi:Kef-type K+ transport system membrane component KefB